MAKKLSKKFAVHFMAGVLFGWTAVSQPGTAQAGNQQPAALTGLAPDHATISVENIERMSAWYVKVMGFTLQPPSDTNPDFLNWHLTIPGYRIDLVKYKGSSRPAPVNPIYMQQGWIHVVFNTLDLPGALAKLQALSTDVVANKDDKGKPTRLVIHDPEGNEVEVVNRQ